MARNRMVNTHFWRDSWIATLTPAEKLLYLYLLTNPEVNIIGVYEIRAAQISIDTGIEESMVERVLQKFQASGRITYMEGWMIIWNFERHQTLSGSRIDKAKKDLVNLLPDKVSKAYNSPNDRVTAQTSNLIKSKSNNKDIQGSENPEAHYPERIAKYFNKAINPKSQLTSGAKAKIESRLKTFSVSDLKLAIDHFSDDRWCMDNNKHQGMAWFFHSDDRIDKYINLTPRKAGDGIVKIS